nr:alpha/beta fold hydrolase [Brevundimonas lenta]
MYRPARPNGAGVVLLHGAGGLQYDAPIYDPHAFQLASRGYQVLAPAYYDMRPARSQRDWRDMQAWRLVAADGARFLGGQPGAEPSRIALWGYSLGGFLAGEATMESDAVAAGVSLAGGTDVGRPGRTRRAVPLLLMHSRRDPVISAGSTKRWAMNLEERGATVETLELDVEGHTFDPDAWCTIFATTRSFLDRTLSVAAP